MTVSRASSALSRFTVLDLTRVRAGPTAARQLADWGANVIKVELPQHMETGEAMGGARHGPDFQNLHRNKRAITLNLKSSEGVEVFCRLVAKADVVVENYRPDVKKRLGIDYAALAKINPRLIYASISGFGQDGPYASRPGFDQIAQGMGGLMSITGEPGRGPMRVGIPVADLSAGLFCALGILVALLEREQSGKGQEVATSLLQAQIFMLDFQASRWLNAREVPPQAGNNHPTSIPTGVFKTRDGHHQYRSRRRGHLGAPVPCHRRRSAAGQPRLRHRRGALQEPRRAQCGHRHPSRRAHQRRVGGALEQCRCALRADLLGRQGVRRSSGRALGRRAGDRHGRCSRQVAGGRPAGVAGAHAERAGGGTARVRRAHRGGVARVRLQRRGDCRTAQGESDLIIAVARERRPPPRAPRTGTDRWA